MADDVNKLARDIVERARAGDQNAMAVIAETRKMAAQSPRAKLCLEAILRYCEQHPIEVGSDQESPKLPAQALGPLGQLRDIAEHANAFPTDQVAHLLLQIAECQHPKASRVGSLFLAGMTPLTVEILSALSEVFEPQSSHCFKLAACGVFLPVRNELTLAVGAGLIAGRGRAIQWARQGRFDILSPRMANEVR